MTHAGQRTEKSFVSANQLGAGSIYKHDMSPLADAFAGEPAYLVGLRIQGNVTLTALVGVNGYLNHAYIVQRALRNIRFVVAGVEHTVNVDGEDVVIDEALRCGASRLSNQTFAALATGAGNIMPVDVCIRLDSPLGITERRHDSTVPVRLFQNSQDSYLEFQVGTSLDTGSDLNVGAAGFASGLTITAYVIHRDDVSVYAPWRLRVIQESQIEHRVVPLGSLEYLFNNNRAVNVLNRVQHSTLDIQSLKVGGETLHSALTVQDYYDRASFDRPNALLALSVAGHKTDVLTTTSGWCGVPIIVPPPDTRKTKLTRGDIGIKLGSMPAAFTDNRIRYLLRETGAASNDHAVRIAQRMGVDPALLMDPAGDVFEVKATQGGGLAAAQVLPLRVKAPSAFTAPTRRFQQFGGRRKKNR